MAYPLQFREFFHTRGILLYIACLWLVSIAVAQCSDIDLYSCSVSLVLVYVIPVIILTTFSIFVQLKLRLFSTQIRILFCLTFRLGTMIRTMDETTDFEMDGQS